MSDSPLSIWHQRIANKEIIADRQQIRVMERLDALYHQLVQNQAKPKWLQFFSKTDISGIYLWGTVGTGKSFLIDTFFDALPFDNKLRIHFHRFMQRIHQELKSVSGHKDPLKLVAKRIVSEACVLCFDEFFVSDMADAMLLAGLLQALFKEGVTLVTNSNCKPDDLYKKGMLRERFFPAIAMIKTHTQVIQMLTSHDYRLRHLLEAGVYYTPLSQDAENEMAESFKFFAKTPHYSTEPITILDREIAINREANGVIWFEFNKICGRPRSQNDYIELAKQYHTILISNVPIIDERSEDLIISFIKLIDVLYDERIKLILSAAAKPKDLYPSGPMAFEFQRTESRLIEMQSQDYFDEPLDTDNL